MIMSETLCTKQQRTIILVLIIILLSISPANISAIPIQNQYSSGSLRSMARVYIACGDNSKAQPLLEKALDLAKKKNAPDSELSACMIDSAYLYETQGKFAEAETMCLAGLELQEKVYNQNHPYVAYTLRILSKIYQGQSRYREAAEVLDRALRIICRDNNEDEQEIAPFKADMGCLLVAQGQYVKAESYFEESIASIEKSFGPNHLYTAKVLNNQAKLYFLQERYDEAEALISQVLSVYEKVFGPAHHFLIPVWLLDAKICQAKGNMAAAKDFLYKCQLMLDGPADCGYALRGEVLIQLGRFYMSSKEYTIAEDVLQKALLVLDDSQSTDCDLVPVALNCLAKVYVSQGKYSEAQKLCDRALGIIETIFGSNHPLMTDIYDTLIDLNQQTNDTTKAAILKQHIEKIRTQQHIAGVTMASVVR